MTGYFSNTIISELNHLTYTTGCILEFSDNSLHGAQKPQRYKRTLKVSERETRSVPYLILPPDNSLPDTEVKEVKEVKKIIAPEIPTAVVKPTHTPSRPPPQGPSIHPPPFPVTLKPSTQKPININIIMPTVPTVKHQTPSSPARSDKQNSTTIDLNLNLGGSDTVEQQKQPIIIQLPPTQRIVAPPQSQQLQTQVNPNNNQIGQLNGLLNPNFLTSPQVINPGLGLPNTGLQGAQQNLVNAGMASNYRVINNQLPLIGSNNNFPGIGSNTNFPGMGSNTNFPGIGSNNNFLGIGGNTNFPGIGSNNNLPGIGSNTNVPGFGSTLPGVNSIIPGVTTGVNNNFPLPGVNSNFQGYPVNNYNPQMVQQLSSAISESIKSSMALSQPDLIASSLQNLANQIQNQKQPEQLLSSALTQALAKTVGENTEASQEQKLINSLASALSKLKNGGTTLGIGTGVTPEVSGASYPPISPNGTPLKVEVVNLPQRYQADQAAPLTGKFQAPIILPMAQPVAPQAPVPPPAPAQSMRISDDLEDDGVGKIAANTLGKAMAKALVRTAKKIVSGEQRDKILKFQDIKNLSESLKQFFKDTFFKRVVTLRRKTVGHKPFSRRYLRDHDRNCCPCCIKN